MGDVDYGRKSSEIGNAQFRRSLYFVKPMKVGEIITAEHIRSVRPGFGLPPKYFDLLLGRKVRRNIEANTAVRQEDLD